MAQNRYIYALFGLSTLAPKPRAEGSSPSAPANQALKNGLSKPFLGGFFFWLEPVSNELYPDF